MPTYEYACTACGNEWEAEQSIKEDPLTECPKCKAATAKRQISRGTGFILKGTGWYSDAYSGSSNAKAPDKLPSTSKKNESSSDSSSSTTSPAAASTPSTTSSDASTSSTSSTKATPSGTSGS